MDWNERKTLLKKVTLSLENCRNRVIYQPYLLFLESLTKPTKATTAEVKEKEGHSISQQSPDPSSSGQSRRSKYDKKLKARLIKTQDRLSQVCPLTQFFSVSFL